MTPVPSSCAWEQAWRHFAAFYALNSLLRDLTCNFPNDRERVAGQAFCRPTGAEE